MKRTGILFVFALALALALIMGMSISVFAEPTPGTQVHLPILTWMGDEADACDVVIEVQNVGNDFTKAAILFWGAPGACPPQCNGPFKVECSGLLKPGSTWNFIGPGAPAQVPAGAKKGIVFSLSARQEGGDIIADSVCETLFADVRSDCDEYRRFKKSFDDDNGVTFFGTDVVGEPLAVEVVRKCQTATSAGPLVSAYSGVSRAELGWPDPVFGGNQTGFMYYTPLLYADQANLNSWIYIQNAGLECTSVEIWLKTQGECIRSTIDEIPTLAPGETIQYNVSDLMGPFWQGNAWIRTSQPAAIAVDNWSDEVLMTYVGRPAELNFTFDPNQAFATAGSQVNYGPLIYREHQGWNTNIQVQNLSSVVNAKVKVYFLDNSGDIIKTVVDWICPRGTQTFPLAVIDGLPGNWVGSVRVESQEWWTPGDPKVLPPNIVSVAELIRWSDPAMTTLLEGVAYNLFNEQQAFNWQIGGNGGGLYDGVGLIGIPSFMNNMSGGGETGLTTELAIANLVPKPGFTDFAIYIYDQNGLLDYVCEKLNEKQVEYINVADDWNYINDGFKGSAVISATFWEHEVFDGGGHFQRNLVGLAAVKVERFNWPLVPSTDPADDAPGDQASASEGFPIAGPMNPDAAFDFEGPQLAPPCPGFTCDDAVVRVTLKVDGNLTDADSVSIDDGFSGSISLTKTATGTYSTGLAVPSGRNYTVTVTKSGFSIASKVIFLQCGTDQQVDFTAVTTADINGTMWVDADADGVIDASEGRLPGQRLWLADTDNNIISGPVLTDGDGDYAFNGVAAGTYKVVWDADGDSAAPPDFGDIESPLFTVVSNQTKTVDIDSLTGSFYQR